MAVESLLWKLGVNTSDFTSKLDQSIAHVGVFAQKMTYAFNAFAGGAVAGAVIGFLDKVVDHAGQIQDTADALGITTDHVQALDYTAKQAGMSVEQLHAAFGMLQGKAADAANGNKQVLEALQKLGIEADAFVRMPVDRQFEAIAKGAMNASDKTEAFGAVADLVGQRNAPRLNAVLQQLAKEGLDGVTESARNMGQVIDASTINRLDDLGDRLAALKNAALTTGATLLNLTMHGAESFGGFTAGVTGWVAALRSGGDATAEAAKNVDGYAASVDALTVKLKGTKATAEDIARAEESREKAAEAAQLAQLTNLQRIEFLRTKIARLLDEEVQYGENTKEALKAQNALTETALKLGEELRKQKAEEAKATDELMRRSQLDRAQAIEMVRLQSKGAATLTEAERLRLDQLKLITEQKKTQAEIDAMLEIPAEKRTKNENDWLAAMVKQSDQLQKLIDAKGVLVAQTAEQAKAESAVGEVLDEQLAKVASLVDQWNGFQISIGRTGKTYESQSTSSLEGVLARLNAQLFEVKSRPGYGDYNTNYGATVQGQTIQSEITNIRTIIRERESVASYASSHGEDAARYMYGDTAVDNSLRDMKDSSSRTATSLEQIADGLKRSGLIPRG